MPPVDDRFMTAGGLAKKSRLGAAEGIRQANPRGGGANERMFDGYFDESDITTV